MKKIENILRKLENKKSISYEEFEKNSDIQDIVLYNLQVAIEVCLDIGSHIISEKAFGTPEIYSDIARILAKNKVIPENFETIFIKMAGFRNIIVHEYLQIDLKRVYNNLQRLQDFREYIKYIKEFLEKDKMK